MMNSLQINEILSKNKKFLGCFPADRIPRSSHYPHSIIVNTDKEGYPGTHWVALYVPSPEVVEYFDSFGAPPTPSLMEYLRKFSVVYRNQSVIQSFSSNACGHFCIYFIAQRSRRVSFSQILRTLLKLKTPDVFVKVFSEKI